MKKTLRFAQKILWAGILLTQTLYGGRILPDLRIENDGTFQTGDVTAGISFFNKNWSATSQSKYSILVNPGYPKENAKDNWELKGTFRTQEGTFDIAQLVKKVADDEFCLEISLSSQQAVYAQCVGLSLTLPVNHFAGRSILVDERRIPLPEDPARKDNTLFSCERFSKCTIPADAFQLEISGDGRILVQDNRKYNLATFGIRIYFTPGRGEIMSSSIRLNFRMVPYKTTPIDMAAAVNMGFADDVPGDNRGGWTDQGPENDLRNLKPGTGLFGGVKFNVIDANANGGKSCLVFGGSHITGTPSQVSVPVSNLKMKYLYLLHALAYPAARKEIGTVTVNYADGSWEEIAVTNLEDVGNWWNPYRLKNADVGWVTQNSSSPVGLYLSAFPVDDKPVTGLKLTPHGDSIWMIAGISAADGKIPHLAEAPCYIRANASWKPVPFPREVKKGSVLDFSSLGLQDAPAGKYGRVVVRNGKFAFQDDPTKSVRFYGANLVHAANFLSRSDDRKVASILASCGYNTVRLHHIDSLLFVKDDPSWTKLNPVELDKLDYLIKCLKDKGIYISIDLFASRKPGIEGILREKSYHIDSFKALVLVSDPAMRNFKTYIENLLTHVNPYTGLAWKDDPALAFICLINEGMLFHVWDKNPEIGKIYEEKFREWKRAQGVSAADAKEDRKLFSEFLLATYNRTYRELTDFLAELGVKSLLTDQNNGTSVQMTLARNGKYDYVDNHCYWAHPARLSNRVGQMPYATDQKNVIEALLSSYSPAVFFPCRIFGLPYVLSEFNYCAPNAYRAAGGVIQGAYASLQDWNGLYCFEYAGGSELIEADQPTLFFDTSTDPMQFLSERLAVLLFLREDVKPSGIKIPVYVDGRIPADHPVALNYPFIAAKIGLVAQVGSIVGPRTGGEVGIDADSQASPNDVLKTLEQAYRFAPGCLELNRKFARSSTGELELDGEKGWFKASTPRSEVAVTLNAGTVAGKVMTIDNKAGFASVSVSSLDENPVADSKRLLFLHLTDTQNSMIRFRDKNMTVIEDRGKLPHLARRGIVSVEMKLKPGSVPEVYGVDLGGERLGKVKSGFAADGTLRFTADTFTFPTPCFVYEIVR